MQPAGLVQPPGFDCHPGDAMAGKVFVACHRPVCQILKEGSIPPLVGIGIRCLLGNARQRRLGFAARGYRREEMTIEEAKKHWTPEQREKADREVAAAKRAAE